MTTFEDNFPELCKKDKEDQQYEYLYDCELTDPAETIDNANLVAIIGVEKHCLSKQRVREAIQKELTHARQQFHSMGSLISAKGEAKIICLQRIQEELGLTEEKSIARCAMFWREGESTREEKKQ